MLFIAETSRFPLVPISSQLFNASFCLHPLVLSLFIFVHLWYYQQLTMGCFNSLLLDLTSPAFIPSKGISRHC